MVEKDGYSMKELWERMEKETLFKLLSHMSKEDRLNFLKDFDRDEPSFEEEILGAFKGKISESDETYIKKMNKKMEELTQQYRAGDFSLDLTEFGNGELLDTGNISCNIAGLVKVIDEKKDLPRDEFLFKVYETLKVVYKVGRLVGIIDAAQFSSVRELEKGQAKEILDLLDIFTMVDEWRDEWEEHFQDEYKKEVLKKVSEQKTTSK